MNPDQIVNINNELKKVASSYVAPICWGHREQNGEVNAKNGTIFFLKTKESSIAVTANHVYEKYLKYRKNNSKSQILNLEFDLDERLIENIPEFDIAKFHITMDEINQIESQLDIKRQVYNREIKMPKKNDKVFFIGYPGLTRLEFNPNELDFGIVFCSTYVQSVSNDSIRLEMDLDNSRYVFKNEPLPSNFHFGGISGCPLFLFDEGLLAIWYLCGIIRQADEKNPGIILATKADKLQ